MRTALKVATVASLFAWTAASASWAQTYITNPGTQGSYSNSQGSYNPNYNQGAFNQGQARGNQGINTGMQGTSRPYGGQNLSQSGYGSNKINTYQEAENELGKYGYSNLQGLKPVQGWSADAMKNGQRVHILLGENGLVATFRGQ